MLLFDCRFRITKCISYETKILALYVMKFDNFFILFSQSTRIKQFNQGRYFWYGFELLSSLCMSTQDSSPHLYLPQVGHLFVPLPFLVLVLVFTVFTVTFCLAKINHLLHQLHCNLHTHLIDKHCFHFLLLYLVQLLWL